MKPNPWIRNIIWTAIMFGSSAYAIPAKYNKCTNIKIKDVPGSSGTFLSEDCSKVYVLPPRVASLTVSGFTQNANLENNCEELSHLEEIEKNDSETAAIYSRRLAKNAEMIASHEQALNSGLLPMGKSREDLENEIDLLLEKNTQIRKKLLTEDQDLIKRKLRAGADYGGWGAFLIQNNYDELVHQFREANPNLSFERMPLDQSFISIVEVRPEDFKPNGVETYAIPAVLSLQIAGVNGGALPLRSNASMLLVDQANNQPSEARNIDIFGDAITGEIKFSTVGACSLKNKGVQLNKISMKDLTGEFAANVTYQYQVQVTRKHSITYNLKELVQQIQEQVKKSGFLSRKTFNKFVDTRRSDSWIEFHVESQDVRFEYTDEYVKEIKAEFLDRVLKQIVAIQTGSPTAHLGLIEVSGKNGSDVIGGELSKCPHLYCQIGAAGFKVLSALFGSESATASLIKTMDGSSSEVVTEKRMVQQNATSTFE